LLSSEDLLRLYQDKDFPGSYSGARTFQMFLKTDKGEDVSLHDIYKVLKTFPPYLYVAKPMYRFPRRQYDVQVKILFKTEYKQVKNFLTCSLVNKYILAMSMLTFFLLCSRPSAKNFKLTWVKCMNMMATGTSCWSSTFFRTRFGAKP